MYENLFNMVTMLVNGSGEEELVYLMVPKKETREEVVAHVEKHTPALVRIVCISPFDGNETPTQSR